MSPDDAYRLCSLAVDLRVTQIVNGTKGRSRHAAQIFI